MQRNEFRSTKHFAGLRFVAIEVTAPIMVWSS
jgi:hypothetical protein